MTKFTLFDNCIIVIDNDNHVLEIFNMNTKKCHNKIGSNGNKILKNYVITCYKSYYIKSFESWNDLLKYYNIVEKIKIGMVINKQYFFYFYILYDIFC